MMYTVVIEYEIRKGLCPDTKIKQWSNGYDDIEPGTSDSDIRKMAKSDFEAHMRSSIDYRDYGRNWIIRDIYFV